MLLGAVASEIFEALMTKMIERTSNQLEEKLQNQAEDKFRLGSRTYSQWEDMIFTIALTGNFPQEEKQDILERELAGVKQQLLVLERRMKDLENLIAGQVVYLETKILDSSKNQILLDVLKMEASIAKKTYEIYEQHRPIADDKTLSLKCAQTILKEEETYKERIQDIQINLMDTASIRSISNGLLGEVDGLFDIFQERAILESEQNPGADRFEFYTAMERTFAAILLIQLQYMQVLLDAYRIDYTTSKDPEKVNPQEFLNRFYTTVFEPEVRGFVSMIEKWLVNVFPYPLSPSSRVDVPEDIGRILAKVDYFAEKTLKPIKEYVTIFKWDNVTGIQVPKLAAHLDKTYGIGQLGAPTQSASTTQPASTTLTFQSNNGQNGGAGSQITLVRRNQPVPGDYDGDISLMIDGKNCQTYRYQQAGVMAVAQPGALQGRIFIVGDRLREYRENSKVLVRIVDSSSGGKQFDTIGLLDFRAMKFIPPKQGRPVRDLGLLVGAEWRRFDQLLMATFTPHITVTDSVPVGDIVLEIRNLKDNRPLQRMRAQFAPAQDSPQTVVHRSFTSFMTAGAEVVSWKTRAAA